MRHMKPKNRISSLVIALSVLALGAAAHAHGEDKPGPNGGEIRMPGAFHTEVKIQGKEVRVYLVDIEFKNPTVENSSVEITAITGAAKNGLKLACRASKASRPAYFTCTAPKYSPVDGDVLKVKAKRGTSTGNEVEYSLPLLKASVHGNDAKKGAEPAASSHDSHHGHGH